MGEWVSKWVHWVGKWRVRESRRAGPYLKMTIHLCKFVQFSCMQFQIARTCISVSRKLACKKIACNTCMQVFRLAWECGLQHSRASIAWTCTQNNPSRPIRRARYNRERRTTTSEQQRVTSEFRWGVLSWICHELVKSRGLWSPLKVLGGIVHKTHYIKLLLDKVDNWAFILGLCIQIVIYDWINSLPLKFASTKWLFRSSSYLSQNNWLIGLMGWTGC